MLNKYPELFDTWNFGTMSGTPKEKNVPVLVFKCTFAKWDGILVSPG